MALNIWPYNLGMSDAHSQGGFTPTIASESVSIGESIGRTIKLQGIALYKYTRGWGREFARTYLGRRLQAVHRATEKTSSFEHRQLHKKHRGDRYSAFK